LFWKGSQDPNTILEQMGYSDAVKNNKGKSMSSAPYETHEEKQTAGNVYLSSPFVFSHGVSFPETNYENRTIAVQCR
jgi:hypothetical protein